MSEGSAITITGEVKLKPWVHAGLLVVFAALAVGAYWLDRQGVALGHISNGPDAPSISLLLYGVFLAAVAYECAALAIQFIIRERGGSPGDVKMLAGFIRLVVIAGVIIALACSTVNIGKEWALVSGFVGLLLGWSLQAPVSGIAAWALVSAKRPFRIGDRVLFPSLGLTGDVLERRLHVHHAQPGRRLDRLGGGDRAQHPHPERDALQPGGDQLHAQAVGAVLR